MQKLAEEFSYQKLTPAQAEAIPISSQTDPKLKLN